MSLGTVVAFGIAVTPICLTPGVSFTRLTQRMMARGRAAGVRVVAETAAGLTCHATLAALGVAALVMRSSQTFVLIKLAGAAYLVRLGASMLWRARASKSTSTTPLPNTMPLPSTATPVLPWVGRSDFTQGLLSNGLNPEAAAVFLTLAPQLIDRNQPVVPQMAALVAAHIIISASWLLLWSTAIDLGRRIFERSRVSCAIDRTAGTVLIALGLRTSAVTR